MTISELIARLEALRAEHGDLPVWLLDDRGPLPAKGAYFEEACRFYGETEETPRRIEIK